SSARSRCSWSSVASCLASPGGATFADSCSISRLRLTSRDLPHRLERVDLAHGLVGAETRYPREPHRVAGLVAIARLDLVEGHLDHGVGDHAAHASVVLQRVLEKVFRHLGDLLIGEARVGLSNVEEALPIADRERVIGEDTAAFSVAPLDRGDHYIERSEGPFHLQPFHS